MGYIQVDTDISVSTCILLHLNHTIKKQYGKTKFQTITNSSVNS